MVKRIDNKQLKKTKFLKTPRGLIPYTPEDLYYGKRKLDRVISKENLLLFKSVLDKHGIEFGIIYGTLLGALREQDFISHDEDTDVFIKNIHKNIFLNAIFDLLDAGFVVIRKQGSLISISRYDDYIDIYFFKKTFRNRWVCNNDSLSAHFLNDLTQIDFLGVTFLTVSDPEEFMYEIYGSNWKIPIEDNHGVAQNYLDKIKGISRLALKGNWSALFQVTLERLQNWWNLHK